MKAAVIILNRNLPEVTDRLCAHLEEYDGDVCEIFVVEAGSDDDNLSRHTTWHAAWDEAKLHGLRFCRGMNYGLSMLHKEGTFSGYDAFFLLTNDTELDRKPTIAPLLDTMRSHPRIGILAPISRNWGENKLFGNRTIVFFWHIMNNAYMLRRTFLESIISLRNPGYMHFLFDGSNFRGFGTESELIAKAYANNWAAAITSAVFAEENETHLVRKNDLIKTEPYGENLRLYLEEGAQWMKEKYGFSNRWVMQQFVKHFYDDFFKLNPNCERFRI